MAAPRGAFSRPFLHTPSPRDHGDGNVLAVGWRVLVASPEGKGHRVPLTDSEGTTTVTTVPHGAEVEILAWRPRRSGATMYRVQPTGGTPVFPTLLTGRKNNPTDFRRIGQPLAHMRGAAIQLDH